MRAIESRLELPDGDAVYWPGFLSPTEADFGLAQLIDLVDWEQHVIRIHGRSVASPRLSAWYGDPGARYSYSGLSLTPRPWLPVIAGLRDRVDGASGERFNSVLLNLYRDGSDSMGWHSDDEPELGDAPTIAAISLGASRRFRLRHKKRSDLPPVAIELEHGSLLIMAGATQQFWKHQVPKTKRVVGPRVNLTFRTIAAVAERASETRSG